MDFSVNACDRVCVVVGMSDKDYSKKIENYERCENCKWPIGETSWCENCYLYRVVK